MRNTSSIFAAASTGDSVTKSDMKIGIFGGTFDPFTEAHMAVVDGLLDNELVDKVVIMPTIVDYYRKDKQPMFYNTERLMFIDRFVDMSKHKDSIVIDDSEYKLAGVTEERRYLHMLEDVMLRYGADNEFYTVLGADSLMNFKTWYEWERILEKSSLLVASRHGMSKPDVGFPYEWFEIDGKYADMSASKAREWLDKTSNPYFSYLKYLENSLKSV